MMPLLFTNIFSAVGGQVLKWGAIALTVLGALLYVKRLIEKGVELEGAKRALEVAVEKKKLDARIHRLPDDDLDALLMHPQDRRKPQGRQ